MVKVADVGDYESISTTIEESYEWRHFDISSLKCKDGITNFLKASFDKFTTNNLLVPLSNLLLNI